MAPQFIYVMKGLRKVIPPNRIILDDIWLSFYPGAKIGVLGPNGAGKSSLMRTLATLQEADGGSVTLEGADGGTIDVLREKEAVRRQLGYLPQDFGVYPKVSAEELLDHFAVLKGLTRRRERREVVEGLLRQVNLWEVRKRKLGGFSGGMRQRFGIAQALLGSPQLLIVDEPTAGLDPEERVRFHNLLSEIGQDVIVLLSTHIVSDVRELCPRMAVLHGGRILLTGAPEEIITRLHGRLWRKFVDKARLAEVQATLPVLSSRLLMGRTLVHVYGPEAPDASFEPAVPDLEDAYFAAIKGHLT